MVFRITPKYTFELTGFRKQSYFECEIPFADVSAYFHRIGDAPAFFLYVEIYGYVIVDLEIYNVNHEEQYWDEEKIKRVFGMQFFQLAEVYFNQGNNWDKSVKWAYKESQRMIADYIKNRIDDEW